MPLILPVPLRSIYFDGFVDDVMTIVLDEDDEDKIERAKGAVPLALHAMFRPTSTEGPVQ